MSNKKLTPAQLANIKRMAKGYKSPFDRGASDSYYGRGKRPHYHEEGYKKVEEKDMTPEQVAEYHRGYDQNEYNRDFKQWN